MEAPHNKNKRHSFLPLCLLGIAFTTPPTSPLDIIILKDPDDYRDIDVRDYHKFRAPLGRCEGQAGYLSIADFDKDGCITYADYSTGYGFYKKH